VDQELSGDAACGCTVKALVTRIRRLEQRNVTAEDTKSQLLANLIRERRRRRLEASGERFEELPESPMRVAPRPGRRLSYAETLRHARQRAHEDVPPFER
jgi:hypothetical protein